MRRICVALISVGLLVLAGCASSSGAGARTGSSGGAGSAAREFEWTETLSSGEATKVALTIGKAAAADRVGDLPDGSPKDVQLACGPLGDEQHAVFIPFEITLTNTTKSQSHPLATAVLFNYDGKTTAVPEGISSFATIVFKAAAGGPATGNCMLFPGPSHANMEFSSLTAIAPGKSYTSSGYAIVPDGVTPNHPNGDPAFFERLSISPAGPDDAGQLEYGKGPWEWGRPPDFIGPYARITTAG
jgi:hypothetical protein